MDIADILDDTSQCYDTIIEEENVSNVCNADINANKHFVRVLNLILNLPSNSETKKELLGGEFFDDVKVYLARILFSVESLFWAKTKDAERGRNAPELFIPEHIKNVMVKDDEGKDYNLDADLAQKVAKAKEKGISLEELIFSTDETWT